MSDITAYRIHVTGIVQGVGFRPFIYGLAQRHALLGWVRNTSAGVDIEVSGPPDALDAFATAITAEAPPLARVEQVAITPISPNGYTKFEILHSAALEGAYQPISPDVCICDDCLREIFDPAIRRYRYAFTNCTNCGPRFTIIQDIPYDRPKTTMAPFEMCPACRAEYEDPLNRRFHAQPNACPVCGPQLELVPAPDAIPCPAGTRCPRTRSRRRARCWPPGRSWRSRGWAAFTSPATRRTRMRSGRCARAKAAPRNRSRL